MISSILFASHWHFHFHCIELYRLQLKQFTASSLDHTHLLRISCLFIPHHTQFSFFCVYSAYFPLFFIAIHTIHSHCRPPSPSQVLFQRECDRHIPIAKRLQKLLTRHALNLPDSCKIPWIGIIVDYKEISLIQDNVTGSGGNLLVIPRKETSIAAKIRLATIFFINVLACYPNFPYASSSTGSHHSFLVSSPGTSTAIWENQLSAFAPCQCFTSAGMVMTIPGSRLTASFPSS